MRTVAMMYVSAVNLSGNCGTELSSAVVHLNCVYSPDETKEEHTFWKASPNGSGKMRFRDAKDAEMFRPGRKFKVYFTRDDEDGTYQLIEATKGGDLSYNYLSIRVQEHKRETYEWAEIVMQIDNPHAWPTFEPTEPDKPVRFKIAFMPTHVTEGS